MSSPRSGAPFGTYESVATKAGQAWRDQDDLAVIEAGAAGNQGAWAELLHRYGRLVYSIPRRHGLPPDACEDIFQEVFLIFVYQLPGIRRRTGLPKWFITTTHRVCRQWCQRERRLPVALPAALSEPLPPPEAVQLSERQHLVHRALDLLGGRCRELLFALYSERQPGRYEQVAWKLGMPQGSIGPTRARCLQKLCRLLDETGQSSH